MKKTILVVEDEKPLLDAIKTKLEKNDFNVLTARSVEQAKNHLMDVEKVDVIWLDHYLLGKERVSIAQMLLSKGIATDYTDEQGDTYLHMAAREAQSEVCGRLVEAGGYTSIG